MSLHWISTLEFPECSNTDFPYVPIPIPIPNLLSGGEEGKLQVGGVPPECKARPPTGLSIQLVAGICRLKGTECPWMPKAALSFSPIFSSIPLPHYYLISCLPTPNLDFLFLLHYPLLLHQKFDFSMRRTTRKSE